MEGLGRGSQSGKVGEGDHNLGRDGKAGEGDHSLGRDGKIWGGIGKTGEGKEVRLY